MLSTFTAYSQLIFKVCIGGRFKIVAFGERSRNGVSCYATNDDAVAEAIRQSSYCKKGLIIDTTPKNAQAGAGEDAGGSKKAQEDNTGSEKTLEKKHFDSITFAKNYLAKEFGVDKKSLKKPADVISVGMEHGIEISF